VLAAHRERNEVDRHQNLIAEHNQKQHLTASKLFTSTVALHT